MTRYELYLRRIDLAEIEATYGGKLWAYLSDRWAAFWKKRLKSLTIGEAEEKLSLRSKRNGKDSDKNQANFGFW